MAIVKNLSVEEYNAIPALRVSSLGAFMRSPAHYKHAVESQKVDQTYFRVGTAVHTLILEPDQACTIMRYSAHKTACQAYFKACAMNPGKVLLLDAEYEMVMRMVDALREQKYIMDMLEGCDTELSITGKLYGVACKSRIDAWNPNTNIIIDLKTTKESVSTFKSSIYKYKYYIQNVFYRKMMEVNGKPVDDFLFVVLEKDAPYGSKVIKLSDEFLAKGEAIIEEELPKFKKCLETGVWGGYTHDIEVIEP